MRATVDRLALALTTNYSKIQHHNNSNYQVGAYFFFSSTIYDKIRLDLG